MARGDAPLRWSDTERVAWKATVPGKGHSSPVVWGDRIFLTTAVPTGSPSGDRHAARSTEHRFMVLAYDRRTGRLLWERVATCRDAASAAPSAVRQLRLELADHRRPARHRLLRLARPLCYTLDGTLVWQKDFGPLQMYNNFGEGAWTALDGNTLVRRPGSRRRVVPDRARQDHRARAVANAAPGQYQLVGPVHHDAQRPQAGHRLRVAGGVGLRPRDRQADLERARPRAEHHPGAGRRRRHGVRDERLPQSEPDGDPPRARGRSHRTPTPSSGRTSAAIRTRASPVLHEGTLYVLTDTGMLSAFDAKTGKPYYQQMRLPKPYNFKASPVGANGKLYLASEERRRHRREDGRDVRGARHEHVAGRDVHRHAGDRRRRDLPAR